VIFRTSPVAHYWLACVGCGCDDNRTNTADDRSDDGRKSAEVINRNDPGIASSTLSRSRGRVKRRRKIGTQRKKMSVHLAEVPAIYLYCVRKIDNYIDNNIYVKYLCIFLICVCAVSTCIILYGSSANTCAAHVFRRPAETHYLLPAAGSLA